MSGKTLRFDMIEKFPRSSATDAREQTKESSEHQKAREHFALRFDWANAVAKNSGEAMADVLSSVTDTYARIFGQRATPEVAETDPRWRAFIDELKSGADPIETAITWRTRYHTKDEIDEGGREFFGPFRYDYDADQRTIWVHFGSMGWTEEERDAPKLSGDIQGALVDLFRAVKSRHPDAERVVGASWLLTRALRSDLLARGLREALPASFVESASVGGRGALGGGRWGQFVDDSGRVHQKRAAEFRRNMQNPELMQSDHWLDAFPLAPTYMEAPIQDFYTKYGIE